jgi:uncharacterized phage-associated protein
MSIPVQDVAKFIVQNSDRISNLKLQKLLYYVQGWHLGLKGTILFPEEIQAWAHGPVVPAVFRDYRVYRWHDIEKPTAPVVLPAIEAKHILSVSKHYGKYAADQLERLSHTEDPWKLARVNVPDGQPSTAVITHRAMRDYFSAKASA